MTAITKPYNLIQAINYQKGSVVSRELINKASGTVTLFAFDANQGLSEHTAPFDALILNLEGKAAVTINKEQFIVSQGETITLPANNPHSLKAMSKFKMLLIMIKN